MNEIPELELQDVKKAVAGTAAALRCVSEYQPAGGKGDKVFPPTYEGGKYATEKRIINGNAVDCVLLNSVQSEANHMEIALRDAWEAGRIELPVIRVIFDIKVNGLDKKITVTSLDAPHRIADAIFRDSLSLDGKMFRQSEHGKKLDLADIRNATGLFGICPTSLVFGVWDSAGPRGGLGAKFQRAVVSEMVGIGAQSGITTGGKVDNLNIVKVAADIYQRSKKGDDKPDWTLDENAAVKEGGNPKKVGKKGEGRPSDVNLGGVTPDFTYAKDNRGNIIRDENRPRIKGGFTIESAQRTTVLSLTALRRLRFPLEGKNDAEQATANLAARAALAALGLSAAALMQEAGADLRSRCQLHPTCPFVWELLTEPGNETKKFMLTGDQAVGLLKDAVKDAIQLGLPWEKVIELKPSPDLQELVQRSQQIGGKEEEGEEEE